MKCHYCDFVLIHEFCCTTVIEYFSISLTFILSAIYTDIFGITAVHCDPEKSRPGTSLLKKGTIAIGNTQTVKS